MYKNQIRLTVTEVEAFSEEKKHGVYCVKYENLRGTDSEF